uniref:Retrotransposon gag domain-containing protein n=1 Tax=Cannabis sativa TaxID=3483 RepID=A0A803PV46_CANSA
MVQTRGILCLSPAVTANVVDHPFPPLKLRTRFMLNQLWLRHLLWHLCRPLKSWKHAATINLAAKNKTPFIKVSLSRPPINHPYRSAWDQCNCMVMAWILQSISREIAASIMFKDSTLAIWKYLHDRFNQSNGPQIFHLKTSLTRIKQGANSITTYFTQLQSLWDELNEFQPFTPCSYGCTCGAMQQIQDHYARDQILQFLIGLNELYVGTRDQILMFDPLPPLSKVFSMAVQQEHQRSLVLANAMAILLPHRTVLRPPLIETSSYLLSLPQTKSFG